MTNKGVAEPAYRTLSAEAFDEMNIGKRVLRLEQSLFKPSERWDSIEDFRDVYELPEMRRYSAEAGRKLIGFGMGANSDAVRGQFVNQDGSPSEGFENVNPGSFYLWTIGVAKFCQGRGIGSTIFNMLVEDAKEAGSSDLFAYLREQRAHFFGRKCELITPVRNFADTGKTYFLNRMRL